jgi:hypothetical protein
MMSWYFCVDKYFGVIILCWLKRAEDDVNGEEDDVNGPSHATVPLISRNTVLRI